MSNVPRMASGVGLPAHVPRASRPALWIGLFLLSAAAAPAADPRLFEAVEPHMGTLFRIKLYAADEVQAKSAFRAAFDRIAQLDTALSDYKSESELNRICLTAVGAPAKISDDLFQVLTASQNLAAETDGAFDVTLGPLIRLWRDARRTHRLPSPATLRDASTHCGYRKLHLDPAARTVLLDQPDMQLDVGGIAKGYAADAALAVLSQTGIRSALVAASGDLAFSDPPPGKPGWKIGIASSDRVLELCNAAVSTSGDTEQHLEIAGQKYSHIIDPRTGLGLTHSTLVTVVARRGVEADGLSTAISLLGPERGMALIEKHPGASLIVAPKKEGKDE
jgi:thiamine biosynthesis lipoprotein